ncbi:hypothetical protein NA57DRAFT_35516 [Rhizodiscina lignyota]|uniref:Mediator of RNA polymerase II transcription subunit 21 n=1 Tax=Rhizodiscina lignyota TaxID=1504668 RepID=A0A9P4IPC9_9PEZI|nr:hypothetical protein NA57DRAFT_35516 [Rhizodiscina lignyota]
MSDRLTQLQDCLDQLLTQMFACIRYIDTHHAPGSIPNQPDQSSDPLLQGGAGANAMAAPASDPPELFQSRLQELAGDLVLKEQQIEALISVLPGVGSSSAAQEARMRALDADLRAAETERQEAVKEKERLLRMVDGVIVGIRRP